MGKRLKIQVSNKLAGCLLIASGSTFFTLAATLRQPAFLSVGSALIVVGAIVFRKKA
jgi:hypothetical protein